MSKCQMSRTFLGGAVCRDWTFKFHKVVRQQHSDVVEDFILAIPQFIYESKSERIIEIGQHLPKLS